LTQSLAAFIIVVDPRRRTHRRRGDPGHPRMSANLKQSLLARSDWFAREIMKGVRASEHAYITPAQSRLLAHMGGKPMSMAELARRLAISRQAVHRTVGELVRRGILEVLDDPQRRNSKRVAYTERGRQVNRIGAQIIAEIEQRLARKLGARRVETLRDLLDADWD
jgi:DNA-binding MarR family transcriptional regulator